MKRLTIVKIFTLIFVGFVFVFLESKLPPKNLSLDVIADRVIQKCRNSNPRDVCYNTEIPKLMKFISMENAFNVTRMVQDKDQGFLYCHVLGHELASIETEKDPSKWKDVIGRCPSGVCSNGCVHGAFQEKYRDDVLTATTFTEAKKEFQNLCENSDTFRPTGLEQGSCYHALGHLLMYVTGGNISKSVSTCSEIAKKSDGRDFSNLCYDGAFMQIFQPLDTDDKSLVRNTPVDKNNAWDFCSQFVGEKKNSCWHESWPLFLSELSTSKGLLDFCQKLDKNGQAACFNNVLYIMPIQFRFDFKAINKYCLQLPRPYQNTCFAMTASRLLEIDKRNIDKAANFCINLTEINKNSCLDQLFKDAKFDFHPDSIEYKNLCGKLPIPWQDKCFKEGNI